jgi:hypothetical protein
MGARPKTTQPHFIKYIYNIMALTTWPNISNFSEFHAHEKFLYAHKQLVLFVVSARFAPGSQRRQDIGSRQPGIWIWWVNPFNLS